MGKRWLRKQLVRGITALQKPQNNLDPAFEKDILLLDSLITQKSDDAYEVAEKISNTLNSIPRPSWLKRLLELFLTLIAAIAIAGLIRQTCIELYEVPTGSMRPTIKEKDRVYVSKTTFGINVPFMTRHLFFSQNRLHRGNIVTLTVDKLDLPDPDTTYFGVFPGKKRYTKRCAALPGDRVYFYGGDLYCLDKHNILHQLKADPTLSHREYLPFSSFEGRVETVSSSPFSRRRTIYLKHFNIPVGRIEVLSDGTISSSIPYNDKWIQEFSDSKDIARNFPNSYGEFFGMKNFATCRLLLPEALPQKAKRLGYTDPKAVCWLEMKHSPTLIPSGTPSSLPQSPVQTVTTWIPLYEEHCQRLMQNLYTARLLVTGDHVQRYHFEQANFQKVPTPKHIPNGCYEFFSGKAYEVSFGGITQKLKDDHPIYPSSIKELVFWFNAGIEPSAEVLSPFSSRMAARFSYWKNKELIVMNTPTFLRNDPVLSWFETQEITRQARDYSYFAFQDSGAPDTESVNVEFFDRFGLKIPEGYYLMLGDNPVMSTDCRYFGFVPEENIQGSPLFIYWPFGDRWGRPEQPRQWISLYSVFMFSLIGGILFAISRRQKRLLQRTLEGLRAKHTENT